MVNCRFTASNAGLNTLFSIEKNVDKQRAKKVSAKF